MSEEYNGRPFEDKVVVNNQLIRENGRIKDDGYWPAEDIFTCSMGEGTWAAKFSEDDVKTTWQKGHTYPENQILNFDFKAVERYKDSILPEFMEGWGASWKLTKRIVKFGVKDNRSGAPENPSPGDIITYSIHRFSVNGKVVKIDDVVKKTGVLGNGDFCEAIEFGFEKMKVGDCFRIRALWALFAPLPPVSKDSIDLPTDADADVIADVDIELHEFAPGLQSNILNTVDGSNDADVDNDDQEAKDGKIKQFAQLIDCAKQVRNIGTDLFKSQRYFLALARYHNACELLAMLDLDAAAALKSDPMMSMMGMKESDWKETQNCLRSLLSDNELAEAKTVYLTSKLNAAQCYLNLKVWTKVFTLCDEVIKQDPSSVKAYYRKAQAYVGDSELKQAQRALKELLKVEPQNVAGRKMYNEVTQKLQVENAAEKQKMQKAFKAASEQEILTGGRVPEYLGEDQTSMMGMGPNGTGGYKPGMSPLEVARSMGNTEVLNVMEEHIVKRSIEEIMETYDVSKEEAIEIRERGGL